MQSVEKIQIRSGHEARPAIDPASRDLRETDIWSAGDLPDRDLEVLKLSARECLVQILADIGEQRVQIRLILRARPTGVPVRFTLMPRQPQNPVSVTAHRD